jgi:hypothetical protein
MEELQRQLRRELLGNFKPISESQGIQFCDIPRMMNEEEHRRRFSCIVVTPINTKVANQVAGSGRPQGLEVAMSRNVGIEEPPQPSLEPDMIDILARPTT